MDDVLGLIGLVLYIVAVISLAGGVTFGVVRLTSGRGKKPEAAG